MASTNHTHQESASKLNAWFQSYAQNIDALSQASRMTADVFQGISKLQSEHIANMMQDLMVGEGPAARSVRMNLPPFTLVGATTRTGLLTSPLRDRFGILQRLVFYEHHELEIILQRLAGLWALELSPEGAHEIAKRSRGTPRIAGRLLRRIRDFAQVAQSSLIDRKLADHALCQLDVDAKGLDAQDRRYLIALADYYQGGPTGLDTLAAFLSEQKDTVDEVIEPYLLQQGFIQRTPRGRVLTSQGYAYLGRVPPTVHTQTSF